MVRRKRSEVRGLWTAALLTMLSMTCLPSADARIVREETQVAVRVTDIQGTFTRWIHSRKTTRFEGLRFRAPGLEQMAGPEMEETLISLTRGGETRNIKVG